MTLQGAHDSRVCVGTRDYRLRMTTGTDEIRARTMTNLFNSTTTPMTPSDYSTHRRHDGKDSVRSYDLPTPSCEQRLGSLVY